uniref:5-HT2-2 n=1 Tax=Sinonovacula constricta TaxID=98310 RepID=A0AA95ZCZ8_SINCO|nr:5-HT2-2 [Sinonovacula constricta]
MTSSSDDAFKEYNWAVLSLLPVAIFGVAGNILVCMAVSMEKRLQSVTNYFLLSLAITDLLVCLVVWPFSILSEFFGYWPLNIALCDLFITSDVLMCTSSILHLCTISLERYLAIRSPLSSRTRSKRTVRIKIFLVWATSLAISSPIMILGFVDETNILNKDQCVLSNNYFIIYGSVSAFFIPLGIMCLLFGFTIYLLRSQWKSCESKHYGDSESIRRSTSNRTLSVTKPVGNKQNSAPLTRRSNSYPDRETIAVSVIHDRTEYNDNCLGLSLYPPRPSLGETNKPRSVESYDSQATTISDMAPVSPSDSQDSSEYRMDFGILRQRSIPIDETEEMSISSSNFYNSIDTSVTPVITTPNNDNDFNENEQPRNKKVAHTFSAPSRLHNICSRRSHSVFSKKDSVKQKQAKSNVKTEQKASKTLGILFATFVICWGPFFIVNIMTVLCERCHFDHVMVTLQAGMSGVSEQGVTMSIGGYNRGGTVASGMNLD